MKLNEVTQRRILLSPLNWGLGHVTRCIGLIKLLQSQGNQLFIACDEQQQPIFENYLENVTFIRHLGYPFNFKGTGKFTWDLIANRKQLLARFAKEQQEITSYIETHSIDFIIADHRYGFFSQKVFSVFLTHQIHLPVSSFFFSVQWIHKRLMRNFNEIWCLDDENNSLAGKLSQKIPDIPIEYIGWFSRFEQIETHDEPRFDALFVVSGPTPYNTQFLEEVFAFCEANSGKFACITPDFDYRTRIPENLKLVVASDWKTEDRLMYQSKIIVSRTGYSTLMDLKITQKKAVLIPTPGQAEQVYLAKLHRFHLDWNILEVGKKWELSDFNAAARH